jgi:hypothetical protein
MTARFRGMFDRIIELPVWNCWVWRSWFIRNVLFFMALYAMANVVLSYPQMILCLRVLEIAFGVAVCVAYSGSMLEAIKTPSPDRFQIILMGVFGSFAAVVMAGLVGYMWRTAGEPAWVINSDLIAFPIWLRIQAAILHLKAKGALGQDVPRAERVRLGIMMGAVAMVLMFALARSGDIAAGFRLLRPIFSDG